MTLMYPKVNPAELEPFFSEHMQAMMVEALHSKADIAVQLAARDKKIIQERVRVITKPQPNYFTIALSIVDALEEANEEYRTRKVAIIADVLSKIL